MQGAQHIGRTLRQAGYRAWLVGGAVRNLLLGREPKDLDIASDAPPDVVKALFEKTIPTGERFGTITVVADGKLYEVTTLRSEGRYSGHHPQQIGFITDLQEDLARRDFTVNAMAIDLPIEGGWTLRDPFGGQTDLQHRIIRAVGDPKERFSEDPLRLMRAVRFAADLGFEIEPQTLHAVMESAQALTRISVERIRQELERILLPSASPPSRGFRLLQETGLLPYVSPVLSAMVGVTQNPRWHRLDVWEHTLTAFDHTPRDQEVRLAVLYHDSGKTLTRSVESGSVHFYGHERVSAELAEADLLRLTFSKRLAKRVSTLCREHMFSLDLTDKAIRRLYLRLDGIDDDPPSLFERLMQVKLADIHGGRAEPGCLVYEKFQPFVKRARQVIDQLTKGSSFQLALSGHDLMAITGLCPGPEVGRLKQALLDYVLEDPTRNTKEALTRYVQSLVR